MKVTSYAKYHTSIRTWDAIMRPHAEQLESRHTYAWLFAGDTISAIIHQSGVDNLVALVDNGLNREPKL